MSNNKQEVLPQHDLDTSCFILTHPLRSPCLPSSSSPLSAPDDQKTNFANSTIANASWNSPASLAMPYPTNPSWCDIPGPQHQTRSLPSTPQPSIPDNHDIQEEDWSNSHLTYSPFKIPYYPLTIPPDDLEFLSYLEKERESFNQLIV